MAKPKSKKRIKNEEIVNSSSHGVGVLIAVACTAILVTRAAILGNAWHIVTFSIFGAGMINLYTASTLFHASLNVKIKHKLNKFDHSSIYVLIAATYTPISLVGLKGPFGWVLFGLIWAMALSGIAFKIWFYTSKLRTLSTILYIAMGWLVLIAIVPIIRNLPDISLWFLLAGGLSYSISTIFYLNRELPYGHGIFHIFILGGSICHFFSIFFLV